MRSQAASFRQLIHLDRSSTREACRQATVMEYYRSVLPGTPKTAREAHWVFVLAVSYMACPPITFRFPKRERESISDFITIGGGRRSTTKFSGLLASHRG
jgi:hypothetical protein